MSVGTVYTLDTTQAEAALSTMAANEAAFRDAVKQGIQAQRQLQSEAARKALEHHSALFKVTEEYRASKAIVNELTRALASQREVTRDLAAEQKKATGAAEQKRLTQELQKSQAEEKKLRVLIQESKIAVEQEAEAVRKVTDARKQELAQQRLNIAAQKDANAARQQAAKPVAPSQPQPDNSEATSGGFFGGLLGKVGPLAAGLLSVNLLIGKIREGIGKAAETSSIQNTFNALTGSAQKGAKEVTYLKQQANALGLDLLPVAQSYKGLFAAAKEANLSVDQTRDIFEAITTEGKVLGISNEKLESSLRAVQQMLSKGVVSSEELRGQLGEALPDATAIAARALGVKPRSWTRCYARAKSCPRTSCPSSPPKSKRPTGGPWRTLPLRCRPT